MLHNYLSNSQSHDEALGPIFASEILVQREQCDGGKLSGFVLHENDSSNTFSSTNLPEDIRLIAHFLFILQIHSS